VSALPEDVWQLWAPVDELVFVGERRRKRDELNLVTAEALRLRRHVVELHEDEFRSTKKKSLTHKNRRFLRL